MSDRFLYDHFDRFERERDRRSWEPHRDDDFLIYLLGSLAQQHVAADPFSISSIHGESAAMALGNWTGYALLCGESLEVAIGFAADCRQYDQAICSLAERVARAMKFVATNKRSTVGQGRPMATWLALASQARSADFNLSIVALPLQ